jgi:hypothetical protein
MVAASAHGEGKTVRVLTIGNSFSRCAVNFLEPLAAAAGDKAVIGRANISACDLARHARYMDAYEAKPDNPPKEGRPYEGKSLKELLVSEPWDVVTIQQVSGQSFKPETFQPHADRLIAYIRKHASQAEVAIHQTWAYRDDHGFWANTGLTPDSMYRGLRAAYDGLAKATGLRQIPGGDAMEAARRDPEWGKFVPDPEFDFKTAKPPALPKERRSLHAGYAWSERNGVSKLNLDGSHPNRHGNYLLSCVWYEFLFGKSIVGNPYFPAGIEAKEAATLQRIAHRVVMEGKRPEVTQT